MTSHATREAERQRTIAQCTHAGLTVTLFVDEAEPSAAANRANAERIIAWALSRDADLLFLEDDIDLAPDFPLALAAARELAAPVTFCTFVAATHHDEWLLAPPPTGFYRPRSLNGWHGTQAVLLPNRVLTHYAARGTFQDGNGPPFDIHLKKTGAVRDLLMAVPNPVQHRSPPSVRDPNRKARGSLTFDMPRTGAWKGVVTPWPSH